jgi:hypothetical protein
VAFLAHFNFNFLTVFVDDTDGQPETDDDKIVWRTTGRDRGHPSALTAGLIADAAQTGPRQAPRFAQRRDRIVGQQAEVLAVGTPRCSGPSLVIYEHTDTLRGEHTLQEIVCQGRVMFRAMQQNDNGNSSATLRHDEAPGEHDVVAAERRIGHIERDAPTGDACEIDAAALAIRK